MNKLQLIGNLGEAPVTRFTSTGSKVISISVATNQSWKTPEGERKERTEWHRVSVFGGLADVVEALCQKGTKVMVEGMLQTRKWTDKAGVERYSTDIIAGRPGYSFEVLSGGRRKAAEESHDPETGEVTNEPPPAAPPASEDVPF